MAHFLFCYAKADARLRRASAFFSIQPVSYTHLDVYKRQSQPLDGDDLKIVHVLQPVPQTADMGLDRVLPAL